MSKDDFAISEYSGDSFFNISTFYKEHVSQSMPVILRESVTHLDIFENLQSFTQYEQDEYIKLMFAGSWHKSELPVKESNYTKKE